MPKTMHEKYQRTFFPLSVVLICVAIIVISIHIATETIPQYLDFKDMQGIILYGDYGVSHNEYTMNIYNCNKKEVTDSYKDHIWSSQKNLEFQFNVDNPNEIYVRNGDEIRTFAIGGKNTLENSYDWYQLPLACKIDSMKLDRDAYLKSVPGKNAISYKIENQLIVCDIDTQERTVIEFPDVDDDTDSIFDAEWLDSETLIYDQFHWINESEAEWETHLYMYNIRTKEKTLFVENIHAYGISINRRYLCYSNRIDGVDTAQIMNMETGEVKEIALKPILEEQIDIHPETGEESYSYWSNLFGWTGESTVKPSPDGRYLLCYSGDIENLSERLVIIVNVETGRYKVLTREYQGSPTTLDWKE